MQNSTKLQAASTNLFIAAQGVFESTLKTVEKAFEIQSEAMDLYAKALVDAYKAYPVTIEVVLEVMGDFGGENIPGYRDRGPYNPYEFGMYTGEIINEARVRATSE